MHRSLVALALLVGCSSQEEQSAGNTAAQSAAAPAAPAAPGPALASLTGLYEGGQATPRNQMCIVEKEGGAEFGLVVWGSDLHSCSGAGKVTREGGTLRLSMAGDSACTIEAKVSGRTISLPRTVPQGCAYYCGARATLGGASLTQKGGTAADAMQAKDLVGEPLCSDS